MLHKLYIEAEDGEMKTIEIAETDADMANIADDDDDDDDRETYGAKKIALQSLKDK